MKLTKYSQLRHGMKVTCKIEGTNITDAKLSKNDSGSYYICQNERDGATAYDKLGYTKSYFLAREGEDADKWDAYVTDLESVEEKEGKFYVGQRVKYDGGYAIPAGEYTIVELNEEGKPRIKKRSDPDYIAAKHFLYPDKCHPIEEKKQPKKKHEQWTPHYTRGGDTLEENRITIEGKEYTPEELKTLCNRYRSVLAAHSKYFPPVK